jgi:hypothetical protein
VSLTTAGLVATTVLSLAGCGATPRALGSPTTAPGSASTTTAASPGTTAASAGAAPHALMAVTTAGALVRLDPTTGHQLAILVPSGVVGDEVAVSHDGSDVYFEMDKGCDHQIWQVGINGGDPSVVAPEGSHPAISPSGNLLAYAQQPLSFSAGCAPTGPDNGAGQWKLVVDNLSTHTEKDLPLAPAVVANGLPFSISHLSWSSTGSKLAVSIAAPEDNEGWALNIVDPANDSYYFGDAVPTVPVAGGVSPGRSYWREGVFQPDGDLFVVRQCCTGLPDAPTAVELDEVSATSGATLHTVATGLTGVGHTSLSVDRTGTWLLYLSGDAIEVSHGGTTPTELASGFVAAAW